MRLTSSRIPGRGDVILVFLGIALRHQEAVVAAATARIFAADGGARFIYGAAALLGVEEAADFPEMLVGLAAHGIGLFGIDLSELLARGRKGQAEIVRQPLHIALLERDQGIGTAIARTLCTIIGRHVPPASNHREPIP